MFWVCCIVFVKWDKAKWMPFPPKTSFQPLSVSFVIYFLNINGMWIMFWVDKGVMNHIVDRKLFIRGLFIIILEFIVE